MHIYELLSLTPLSSNAREGIARNLGGLISVLSWAAVIYGVSLKIIDFIGITKVHSQSSEVIYAQSEDEESAIIKDYYKQVLDQSKIGFIVGIVSFIAGILFIFYTYNRLDFSSENVNLWATSVPGIVIEAVSALIIVQTNNSVNNARNAMIELREKRITSRRIEEALEQVKTIEDEVIKSKVKSVIVLHFSGLTIEKDYLREILVKILSPAEESQSGKSSSNDSSLADKE